jgi:hypothetical protein
VEEAMPDAQGSGSQPRQPKCLETRPDSAESIGLRRQIGDLLCAARKLVEKV